MFADYLPLWMFVTLTVLLMAGFPVAFTLLGTSLCFGLIGFGWSFFNLLPLRVWGIMTNATLMAVPLFVFMGVMLEQSGLARNLLDAMGALFGKIRGGLALSVVLVGALLGASTGIVGATVVTMGLLAVPAMLENGYRKELACGTVAASGTLGQIIPPSIVLILIGDIVGVPVGDLFVGAVLPGFLLVLLYILYIIARTTAAPPCPPAGKSSGRAIAVSAKELALALAPPLLLVVAVLGSIFAGIASPTEAAGVGAMGAVVLAISSRRFSWRMLDRVARSTMQLTSMVFIVLVGATAFGLVFRGTGGDALVRQALHNLSDGLGPGAVLALVMLFIFVIGFFLDFIEITFIHVPVLAPVIIDLGIDPVWLCVLIAVNLQTSFLTPPFGFSLFYLRAVVPPGVSTAHIYRGVIPFVLLQLAGLLLIALFPGLVTVFL